MGKLKQLLVLSHGSTCNIALMDIPI